jgi:hypothetical protein
MPRKSVNRVKALGGISGAGCTITKPTAPHPAVRLLFNLPGIAMTPDWRKRITWLSMSDVVRILEDSFGISCEGYDDDDLRETLTGLIEANPILRFKLPHMHSDEY